MVPAVNMPGMLVTSKSGIIEWSDMPWLLGGNDALNGLDAIKNLGTKTNFDLPFITDNTEKMRLTTIGRLGLGTTIPDANFHINATPLNNNGKYQQFITTSTAASDDNIGTLYRNTGGAWTGYLGASSSFPTKGGLGLIAGQGDKEIMFITEKETSTGEAADPANANNALRMIVKSNGNVGINTPNPSALLHLVKDDSDAESKSIMRITAYDSRPTKVAPTIILDRQRGRVGNAGNLQNGDLLASISMRGNAGGIAAVPLSAITGYYVGNGTNVLSDIRFNLSGTADQIVFSPNGSILPTGASAQTLGSSTNAWGAVYTIDGTVQKSDIRLKTNITPLKYGLADVLKIDPISYNWKQDITGKVKIGVSAQQVQTILPEVVNVGDDANKTLSVNYAEMVPVLINAIKEQQTQIEELKALVKQLADKK